MKFTIGFEIEAKNGIPLDDLDEITEALHEATRRLSGLDFIDRVSEPYISSERQKDEQ